MEDRTFINTRGVFTRADFDGTNKSGLRPLCDMVLVLVDYGSDRTPSGNLIVPDTSIEATSLGSTTGVLIRCGPQAFAYDADRLLKWEGDRPKPGDRVWFQRYAGQEHVGNDTKLYRIMQDRAVAAVEDHDPGPVMAEAEAETIVVRASTARSPR
jgi:chaperonin GroES